MNKGSKSGKADMKAEYKLSDFTTPFVRGKYSRRLHEGCNVVVLDPVVARAFPDSTAVNSALFELIRIAERAADKQTRPARSAKPRSPKTK